jgi:folate-binding protein YgfZ
MSASGAEFGTYSGAETALRFASTPEEEFHRLTEDVAVYDLSWRAKIAVTGEDRVRWLNGMVTNNIRDLAPGKGNYNFLLNAKGHILGDLYVFNRGDSLWIETERSQAPQMLETLNHFIIMDDVELTDISDGVSAIGVQGPNAKRVLESIGVTVSEAAPMQYTDLEWRGLGITLIQRESPDFPTYEIWAGSDNILLIWNALIETGATPVGTRALEMFRVMAGVPKFAQDIRTTDLPQETAQEHALNFTKGCYIGQEIVERIRSRGAVRRTFTGFIAREGTPAPGVKLTKDGTEVGVITSVEKLGELTLCLGYIRREALQRCDDGKDLIQFEGGSVQPHLLPFTTAQVKS